MLYKFAGLVYGALQLHGTDRERYGPLATTVALLMALKRVHPDAVAWRTTLYEFVSDRLGIDLLSSDTSIRDVVDGCAELPELRAGWRRWNVEFNGSVKPYLLYTSETGAGLGCSRGSWRAAYLEYACCV